MPGEHSPAVVTPQHGRVGGVRLGVQDQGEGVAETVSTDLTVVDSAVCGYFGYTACHR